MARTAINVVKPATSGTAPNLGAADSANGMLFPYRTDSILHVKNGNASSLTLTILTNIVFADGLVLPNQVITVAATTGEVYCARFGQQEYQQTDGNVYVNFSISATVTVEVIQPQN